MPIIELDFEDRNEESFGDEEKGASSYDTFAELLYDITNLT